MSSRGSHARDTQGSMASVSHVGKPEGLRDLPQISQGLEPTSAWSPCALLCKPQTVASLWGRDPGHWDRQLPAQMLPLVGPTPSSSRTQFAGQREGGTRKAFLQPAWPGRKSTGWSQKNSVRALAPWLPDPESSARSDTAQVYYRFTLSQTWW